jgi:hypothetical protein
MSTVCYNKDSSYSFESIENEIKKVLDEFEIDNPDKFYAIYLTPSHNTCRILTKQGEEYSIPMQVATINFAYALSHIDYSKLDYLIITNLESSLKKYCSDALANGETTYAFYGGNLKLDREVRNYNNTETYVIRFNFVLHTI